MKRRTFLASLATTAAGFPLVDLGAVPPLAPVDEAHFPNRLYQFVWRN